MTSVLLIVDGSKSEKGGTEMKLIVLAGGRGKRMGMLTSKKQKAVLPFNGSPLLKHVINGFLNEIRIGKIYILTGYRCEDVHSVLMESYPLQLETGKISCVDLPSVTGTLSRLKASISEVGTGEDCLVCGIDSLVPFEVSQRFLDFCEDSHRNVSLLLSPYLQIAPTHKVATLHAGRLCEYECADSVEDWIGSECFTDVGIRYFPAKILEEIASSRFENDVYIPTCIKALLRSGSDIRGFVFQEDWKHFAYVEDLVASSAS